MQGSPTFEFMKTAAAFIGMLILLSCGNNSTPPSAAESRAPKTAEDSLFHQVMEGHDAGMAKMGKLAGYKKQIVHTLDSLKNAKTTDKELLSLLNRTADSLGDAETAMFVWMDEFRADTLADNKEARIQYLQKEKERVNEVKERLFNSLKLADSSLLVLKPAN